MKLSCCLRQGDASGSQPVWSDLLAKAQEAVSSCTKSPAVDALKQHAERTGITEHQAIIAQALADKRSDEVASQLSIGVQQLPLKLRKHPGSLIWAGISAGQLIHLITGGMLKSRSCICATA